MASFPTIPPTLPPVELPSAETLAPIMTSWCPRSSMLPDDFPLPNVSLPPQCYGTEFMAFSLEESLRPPALPKAIEPHDVQPDKSQKNGAPGRKKKPSGAYAYVRPPTAGV